MVKIPFSKSEIFVNKVLTFKEKRQLVKVIEYCLFGSDKLKEMQESSKSGKKKPQNSTHVYDKDTSLSQTEQQDVIDSFDKPIMQLLNAMSIEKRLGDILLYALGMINDCQTSSDLSSLKASDFYRRIAKYLRSIGYYGDSPFLLCNYGSSEYSQAFSRVGSLFGNVYIVNNDVEI